MTTSPMDGAKSPVVYPQALQLARASLAVLARQRTITPPDLRQRAEWMFGAQLLAAAVGDQASADLLLSVDTALRDLAINHRDTDDTLVTVTALMANLPAETPQ